MFHFKVRSKPYNRCSGNALGVALTCLCLSLSLLALAEKRPNEESQYHPEVKPAILPSKPLPLERKNDNAKEKDDDQGNQGKGIQGKGNQGNNVKNAAQLRDPIYMKILVIAVDGTEPTFAGIQAFLDQIGMPYDQVFARTQPLPPLSDGAATGYYQGIVLTTGNLGFL
jgi:hypothetical protein